MAAYLSLASQESRQLWKAAEPEFLNDGQETLLIRGKEVMQRWEDGYMYELSLAATENGGRVLEVGFGLGISATYVQELGKKTGLREHVIIEPNDGVFARLENFAKEFTTETKKVTPMRGFWEEVVPTLESGSFDGILFDPYPIDIAEEGDKSYGFANESLRLLRKGGIFSYYSNEVDDFSEQHMTKLKEYGWEEIYCKTVEVHPPETCEYWKWNTMLVPKLIK